MYCTFEPSIGYFDIRAIISCVTASPIRCYIEILGLISVDGVVRDKIKVIMKL